MYFSVWEGEGGNQPNSETQTPKVFGVILGMLWVCIQSEFVWDFSYSKGSFYIVACYICLLYVFLVNMFVIKDAIITMQGSFSLLISEGGSFHAFPSE